MSILEGNMVDSVIQFAVTIKKVRIPPSMTISDVIHETRVRMFRYCKQENPNPSWIIRNANWAIRSLIRREKNKYKKEDNFVEYEESLDVRESSDYQEIDDKEYIDKVMANVVLSKLERTVAGYILSGFSMKEIQNITGFSNRYGYAVLKTVIEKIKNSQIVLNQLIES